MNIRKIILLLGILCSSIVLKASVQFNFETKTFYSPISGPYLETHINFLAGTMKYQRMSNNSVQSKISSLILIKKGEEIIDYQKLEVLSPMTTDSTLVDFIDLQRFSLAPGDYELEVQIMDMVALDSIPNIIHKDIHIPTFDEVSVGDIIYLSAWNKTETPTPLSRSGLDMVPRMSDYFDSYATKIGFYTELYHTNTYFEEKKNFALATYIENSSNLKMVPKSLSIRKQDTSAIIPLFLTKSIDYLKEGQYNLVIEIRSQQNEVIKQQKISFIKSGSQMTPEVSFEENISFFEALLDKTENDFELIQSHLPIASPSQKSTIHNTLEEDTDPLIFQNFLRSFWEKKNPQNPIQGWLDYEKELEATDNDFGTRVRRGFETDRGFVYLKYGPPNTRVVRQHDVGAVPYEIWHYYKAGKFSNKRFVFIDSDLSTNDFRLIQSDMPGEITTPNWIDLILTNQANNLNSQSSSQMSDVVSLKSFIQDLYLNPR